MRSRWRRSAALFVLVGAVGFFIDGGLLTLLSRLLAINIYLSRLISFSVATLVTWALNRTFTFRADASSARKKSHEYLSYLAVQSGGALLNLGVFSLLVAIYPRLQTIPIVPLAIGALFGLVFNYSGSRYWTFRAGGIQG